MNKESGICACVPCMEGERRAFMKPVTDVLHNDLEEAGNHGPTVVVDVVETRQYGHKRLRANRKTETEEALGEPFMLRSSLRGKLSKNAGYMDARKWTTVNREEFEHLIAGTNQLLMVQFRHAKTKDRIGDCIT